jgi:site-specific DNA-methyltransferase (adenine-specific)
MTLAVVETDGLISAPQRKERLMSSNKLTNDLAQLNVRETLKRTFQVNGSIEDKDSCARHNDIEIQVHKNLKNILEPLDALYPIEPRLDLGPFVHWRGNAASPMHRWLRYREAYSPELIEKLQLGNRILDPFSGCGSIPIGAAIRGRSALGICAAPDISSTRIWSPGIQS